MSPVAALVRRHDRDRYQTALFAPVARREALLALYAFNYEIARVRESVTHPTLGRIRLEWWRENIAAAYGLDPAPRHPVAAALISVIRERRLTRYHLDRLIDARETDLDDEPSANLAAMAAYAEDTASRLIYLALEVLDACDAPAIRAARHVGIALALSGLLRALPLRMATGRPLIPADVARRNGLDVNSLQELRNSASLCAAVAEIAAVAEDHLRQARVMRAAVPRAAIAALLPAVIADRSLRRLRRADYDPLDPLLQQSEPLQIWRLSAAMLRHRF